MTDQAEKQSNMMKDFLERMLPSPARPSLKRRSRVHRTVNGLTMEDESDPVATMSGVE